VDVQNSGLYNPVRNPVGVKKEKCGTCSDGKEILLRKKKERPKFTNYSFLNWKAIGNATYFREYLRDYMKKWVDENKNQTDLIMTSTKMD
jgi:penicillin-binding protein 1A